MIGALRVAWRAMRHIHHRGYLYVWANVACVLCSLPVFTAPAAWAGLARLSYIAHTTPTANLDDYWMGFKSNLRRGLLLGVLNLLIFGINVSNLLIYTGSDPVTFILRGAWVLVISLWVMMQFYLWPLFYHMEQPTLSGAARNAVVMMFLNPLFTLTLLVIIMILSAVSTYFIALWPLLTISFFAVLSTTSVLDRLNIPGYISEYNAADE